MDAIRLLLSAKNEIVALRSQNQLMAARLGVFDDMMMLLKSAPVYPTYGGMSPDLVYEIDKAIECEKSKVQPSENIK